MAWTTLLFDHKLRGGGGYARYVLPESMWCRLVGFCVSAKRCSSCDKFCVGQWWCCIRQLKYSKGPHWLGRNNNRNGFWSKARGIQWSVGPSGWTDCFKKVLAHKAIFVVIWVFRMRFIHLFVGVGGLASDDCSPIASSISSIAVLMRAWLCIDCFFNLCPAIS